MIQVAERIQSRRWSFVATFPFVDFKGEAARLKS